MPVRFSRLRVAGFKSFADPATVELLPGLTGIVGPNGCGKSNVIEALRWAMGEGNARNMRGAEMEDVIFAGTAGRAARNLAEVTLTLEETLGMVPPPFHEQAELEITRKIERGLGSVYRVNGKETRARDVQTLFADLASGARASAMIGQGRVSALVNARPEERRALLEEAAGITGLHSRRHEAELKLRAAEQNLARADDLKTQLESRLKELQRQARQATRYRNLSGAIRAAEAELLALQRAVAEAAREMARAAHDAAEAGLRDATLAATQTAARAATTEAMLPELRSEEGEARTALERARIGAEQSAEAETRARAALAEARARLETLTRDHLHAMRVEADSQAALARLDDERSRLTREQEAAPADLAQAGAEQDAALEEMRLAEAAAHSAMQAAAQASAETDAVRRGLSEAEARAQRAAARRDEVATELRRHQAAIVSPENLAAAHAEQQAAENDLAAAREAVSESEARRAAAESALAAARAEASATEGAATRVATEYEALRALLAQQFGREAAPILDSLSVPPGLETALGAALGQELSASAELSAARHWRLLPPLGPDAAGVDALAGRVQGPAALTRALSHVLLLPEGADGDVLQAELKPGQLLVSSAGDLWRWDGYTVRAGAKSEAAVRLAQRNRLLALEAERDSTKIRADSARVARVAAESAEHEARTAERAARETRRLAEQRHDRARSEAIRLSAEAERAATREAAARSQHEQLAREAAEAEIALASVRGAVERLPDLAALRAEVEQTGRRLATARQAETAARQRHSALEAELASRAVRLEALKREQAEWRERGLHAADRLADLAARRAEAAEAAERLEAAPEAASQARREMLDALEATEGGYRRAAEALGAAQTEADEASRAARAAEAAVSAASVALARSEGELMAANHAWGVVAERILERLGPSPALPDPPAELGGEAEEKARRRWERLLREREEMGPVNLRAELEAGEAEQALAALEQERAEIGSAIAKLRGSIGHLNREGRERLQVVFTEVDQHFQALFTRMFGGGKAHLMMVGSDDPLEAGLEIYAQPPGKKLSTLSLLSGGEQALTALSLIFAVFKCNPAPISVLDEVDAPLDDANVERFCKLLEDMVRQTNTRFLVVTHHHLTMARMDRLYGVTMQERGISRLVSVELSRAVELVEPGHALAAE